MFLITFDADESIDNVHRIIQILGCRVQVHPLKSSKVIPQCKNCQSFGHTKTYCARQARCVKCAGKHKTDGCTKSKDVGPKCVNCGGNHPASYRGCFVAKELQAIRNKKLGKLDKQPPSHPIEMINKENSKKRLLQTNPIASYANIVKNIAADEVSNMPKDTLGKSIEVILQKLTQMESSLLLMNEKVKVLEGSKHLTAPINTNNDEFISPYNVLEC